MAKKRLKGLPNTVEDFDWDSGLFMVALNLPFECNYHCLKCAFDDTKSIEPLPPEKRLELVREASDMGARLLLIEGEGEPFATKEFRPLVSEASKGGLTSLVFTNGSFLTPENAGFCYDHDVSLIVSVDSLRSEVYDVLTGSTGNLSRVLRNFEEARAAYSQRGAGEGITRLALTSLITQQNKDEIPRIKEFCGEDILYLCNTPLNEGNARRHWQFLTGVSEDAEPFPEEFSEIKATYSEGPKQLARRSVGGCAVLLNGLELTAQGDLLLCAGGRSLKLGDAREKSLADLWTIKKEFLDKYDLSGITCFPRERAELYAELSGGR